MLHSPLFLIAAGFLYFAVFFYGARRNFTLGRQFLVLLLYASITALLARSVFPINLHGNSWAYTNLKPLSHLEFLKTVMGTDVLIREIARWFVLYAPVGFLLPLLCPRLKKVYNGLLIGLVAFAGVEIIRHGLVPLLIGARYANLILDELILAVMGSALGFTAMSAYTFLLRKLRVPKPMEETASAAEPAVSPSLIMPQNPPAPEATEQGLVLQAIGLTKIYGSGDSAVKAVSNVSISFDQGDFAAIMGASGSGKSTLLHLMSTLDLPTAGQVFYQGQDIFALNNAQRAELRRRHFGFVFQFFNLVPILTVAENITLPILMDGAKPDQAHVDMVIDMLGIRDKANTLPSKLSGGQQQRVAIARALSAKPAIVFADEPTGNLDSKNSKEIIKLFQETARAFNQTMVIVTHDPTVAAHCSRVIELEDGIIISDTRRAAG